jgi:glycerol uptake facilitator-like aquaporin
MATQVQRAAASAAILLSVFRHSLEECNESADRYPATMLYYRDETAELGRFRSRPSTYSSMKRQVVEAFATFKSLSLQPRDEIRY